MQKHRLFVLLFVLILTAVPAAAQTQTVLFDGLAHADRQGAALLIPTIVAKDVYGVAGRFEYGLADRVNLFGQVGGVFNGGATALLGGGWALNVFRQTEDFPVNIGFFNSILFPIERGGPDALVTVAPIFSHSWKRGKRWTTDEKRVTPYAGATATFKIDGPGRGDATDINALIGLKVTQIADRWDFVAEVQPGEQTLFAFLFAYRF